MPADEYMFDFPDAVQLAWDQGWWDLYNLAFCSAEREPPEVVLRTVEIGAGFVARVRSGNETVGLAAAQLLRRPKMLFITYLAVSPQHRRKGLGVSLFEKCWSEAITRSASSGVPPLGIVWEVARPCPDDLGRFYTRAGGGVLTERYVQPPVDGEHWVPMTLMVRLASWYVPQTGTTTEIVQSIYREKYGSINGIPEAMLAQGLQQGE